MIFLIFVSILFGANIFAKAINAQSKNTESIAFSLLKSCAYNDSKACDRLLKLGFRSVNECVSNECGLIGATLMGANRNKEAIEYLKKACRLKILSSCKNLGIIFENMNDMNNAKAFYNDGCKFGDIISCYNLALLYAHSSGGEGAAMQTFKMTCDLFYAKSCYNLAVLHYKNHNTQRDSKSFSKYYFNKACNLGLQEACENLAVLGDVQMPPLQKVRGLYIRPIK